MKRIAFILAGIFVGIIALLESSRKHTRSVNHIPDREMDNDVWLGN
jgi:preprotein translocase subunit SecG